jgi:hypothetical protein
MRLRTLTAVVPVVAALGLAAPVAGANAQSTPLLQRSQGATETALVAGPSGSGICVLLLRQLQFAEAIGNPILANLVARTFVILGCAPHFGPGPVVPPRG